MIQCPKAIGLAILFPVGLFVQAQEIKERNTTIKSVLTNYVENGFKGSVTYIYNPIDGRMQKDTVAIDRKGSFIWHRKIAYPQEIVLLSEGHRSNILLNPGNSLLIRIDSAGIHQPRSNINQALLDDQKHYEHLNLLIENGKALAGYNNNDRQVFSIEHISFIMSLYRHVTSVFTPDSTVLYKTLYDKRDIVSLSKLIISNIHNKTNGFTRDVFYTRFFMDALGGNQLRV
jgi:hypothetical protein